MNRWGKPIKNKRRGNPKYRLDESNAPAEPNMEALGKAESVLKAGGWLNHMGMPTSGDGDWSHEINPDNGRIKLYFNGGFLGTILPDGEYTSYVDSAAGSDEPIHKSLHPLVKALKAEPSLKRKPTEDPHAISSWAELRERKSMQNLFEGFNRFLNESKGDIRTEYGHQWKYEGDDGGNELYTHMGSGRTISVRGTDPTVGMKSWLEKNKMQVNESIAMGNDPAESLAQALLAAYRNSPSPERYPSIQSWIIEGEVEPAVVAWSEENSIPDDMYHSPEFEVIIERAKELVIGMEGEAEAQDVEDEKVKSGEWFRG